jgi:hypothetical protein
MNATIYKWKECIMTASTEFHSYPNAPRDKWMMNHM